MNQKALSLLTCAVGLIAIVLSQALETSDFVSGIMVGVGISIELIAIIVFAKAIKAGKKDKE